LHVDSRVPDVEVPHLRELSHRLTVRAGGRRSELVPDGLVEAAVAPGDGKARHEALHVPLERPRQGLVEVVDAEDELPIWRREYAEVREVRVTAELDVEPAARPSRKIRGHEVRGPTIERERRDQH